MITYQYTQKDWTTFKEGIKREWAVTNGIGGYAGSSMIGAGKISYCSEKNNRWT